MSFYAAEAGQLQDDGELARCVGDAPVIAEDETSAIDRRSPPHQGRQTAKRSRAQS